MATHAQRMRRLTVAVATALAMAAGVPPMIAESPPLPSLTRIGGSTRYDTMAQIVASAFQSCESVVLCSGEGYPDALSASALAGALRCPVVLADQSLTKAWEVIERLGAKSVTIVGGPSAVGESAEALLASKGLAVTRVAGADRAETSVAAMRAARAAGSESDTVIVCTGEAFADSLSISPWSWNTASPIVLARNGRLTAGEVDAIRSDPLVGKILVVGGQAAVGDVASQLGDGYACERLSGSDRYETSASVAEWECAHGFGWKTPAIATGLNFPDALAGSALLGSRACPLLLVADGTTSAGRVFDDHWDVVQEITVLGGESSVSPQLAAAVAAGDNTARVGEAPFDIPGIGCTFIPPAAWKGKVDARALCIGKSKVGYTFSYDGWDMFGIVSGETSQARCDKSVADGECTFLGTRRLANGCEARLYRYSRDNLEAVLTLTDGTVVEANSRVSYTLATEKNGSLHEERYVGYRQLLLDVSGLSPDDSDADIAEAAFVRCLESIAPLATPSKT